MTVAQKWCAADKRIAERRHRRQAVELRHRQPSVVLARRGGWEVYASSFDSSVYALNASTGALLWSDADAKNGVAFSPAVANGVVYAGTYFGNLYALNAGTGDVLWDHGCGFLEWSSPAVANGMVYIGSDDTKSLRLRPAPW